MMVTLSKIYTKTGDGGETALGDGSRVRKDSLRVETYGTVDELNAFVGLACTNASGNLVKQLNLIQNDLFDLGADLCTPSGNDENLGYEPLRMVDSQISRLEAEIDHMNASLSTLKSFVLPGGSALSAQLHICRTVCRRAERYGVELSNLEEINTNTVKYLNRLSDWFFVAARFANLEDAGDVLWVPGANR